MAKNRNRNADATEATADAISQPAADASTDEAAEDAHDKITMDQFLARPDRADWLSVAEAASFVGGDVDAQKMRNAANNRKEFKPFDARLFVTVPGYQIKPLSYLHRSAVELYRDNQASGVSGRGGKIGENGKRWIIRVKPENESDVREALAAFGIALETASAPHKSKKDADASAPAADAGTTTTPIEDAIAAASTDGTTDASAGDRNVLDGSVDQWSHAEDTTADVTA